MYIVKTFFKSCHEDIFLHNYLLNLTTILLGILFVTVYITKRIVNYNCTSLKLIKIDEL